MVFRKGRIESREKDMNLRNSLTLLVAAVALAACQSSPMPRALPPVAHAPTVDGTWSDPNGIVSTFQAGAFNTRTTDTNQLLATGTYTNVADRMVEINMTSLVRKTQSKVNCALATPNQLNCTSDAGAQFSLARRS